MCKKKELDYLENNIIKTISRSFAFTFNEVKNVYEIVQSFDKTIEILKYAASNRISLQTIIELKNLGHA